MTDRRPADMLDLEVRLADLAGAIAFPATPDLATAVGTRLRARAVEPRTLPSRLPMQRSIRRSVLLAAALTLAIVGGALAVRFGLELLNIRFGPVPTISAPPAATPAPSPAPSALLGSSLRLGQVARLDDVLGISSFRVMVPEQLGPPDIVYVGGASLRGQVAFVYGPRDTIPLSGLLGGAGLLITQARGELDNGLVEKLLDAKLAMVERFDVNGAPGVWISGKPHIFWYLGADGQVIEESRRYVGDTLAWEMDGVLYRIEGDIPLERALEIAASMR